MASIEELQRNAELDMARELEAGLAEANELATFSVDEAKFVREGLPILSQLASQQFNPQLWSAWAHGNDTAVAVYSNGGQELLYTIPPLMRAGATLVSASTYDSFSNMSAYADQMKDTAPNAPASVAIEADNRLQNKFSMEAVAKQKLADTNLINEILAKYSYPLIPLDPDMVAAAGNAVEAVKEEVATTSKVSSSDEVVVDAGSAEEF